MRADFSGECPDELPCVYQSLLKMVSFRVCVLVIRSEVSGWPKGSPGCCFDKPAALPPCTCPLLEVQQVKEGLSLASVCVCVCVGVCVCVCRCVCVCVCVCVKGGSTHSKHTHTHTHTHTVV